MATLQEYVRTSAWGREATVAFLESRRRRLPRPDTGRQMSCHYYTLFAAFGLYGFFAFSI